MIRKYNTWLLLLFMALIARESVAQGIEDVIVERFYESVPADTAEGLPLNSVTYRIYIDMAAGYRLQTMFGQEGHPLSIKTTTHFFNHAMGEKLGNKIDHDHLNTGSFPFDSYLTINAVSKTHVGVLKSEDPNGSILVNSQLKPSDGMVKGEIVDIFNYELDLRAFERSDSLISQFYSENALLAILGGVKGPTSENKVLVAQVTTDGELSFELNIQLGVEATKDFEQYVAKNPVNDEILFEKLTYNIK